LVAPVLAQAVTHPGGPLPASQVWTAADNPHLLTGDLVIPDGVTLTLEAGVHLLVLPAQDDRAGGRDPGRTEVVVEDGGTLRTRGSPVAPVVLESAAPTATAADWYGVTASGGRGVVDLSHVTVRHALYGVQADGLGSLVVRDAVVETVGVAAVEAVFASSVVLERTLMVGTVHLHDDTSEATSWVVRGNTFVTLDRVTALALEPHQGTVNVLVSGNSFRGPVLDGVSLEGVGVSGGLLDVRGNDVDRAVVGVKVRTTAALDVWIADNVLGGTDPADLLTGIDVETSGHVSVLRNQVVGHAEAAVRLARAVTATVRHNDFSDGSGGVALRNDSTSDVDARSNWWGPAATAQVLQGENPQDLAAIHDRFDNPELGRVDYGDWLEAAANPACVEDDACADGNPCTDSTCLAVSLCIHRDNSAPCSDQDACTHGDQCVQGTCVSGAPVQCDDGLSCNGVETCDGVRGCVDGSPPDCSDGVSCTRDSCDDAQGGCVSVPEDAACDDGLSCNGMETCDGVRGCVDGSPPDCSDGVACTRDSCDDAQGGCLSVPEDVACDDGLFCNGMETCDGVRGCVAGAPPDCSDGVSCTRDSCDDAQGGCLSVPEHAACDDGLSCNGVETCDGVRGCVAGAPPDCSDGVACTRDVCDDVRGGCLSVPEDAACDDGLSCNGAETCDAGLGCVDGAPPACSDGVACTRDSCDDVRGGCVSVPEDTACDDGLFCNGAETCDGVWGCRPGAAPPCSDGIPCTVDRCDESSRSCAHVPDHAQCDDGRFCTGVETCDPRAGCVAGAPPTCADQSACTRDLCDPASDVCRHAPDNGLCQPHAACVRAEGVFTCACLAGYRADDDACEAVCGDGLVVSGEACDDGNTTSDDGCTPTCTVQLGWSCTRGEPSVCQPTCGDGLVNGAEECDDRNRTAGDGCSTTCVVEPGWTCDQGAPTSCTPHGEDTPPGDKDPTCACRSDHGGFPLLGWLALLGGWRRARLRQAPVA
jgi:cysteine-rich repeat protein